MRSGWDKNLISPPFIHVPTSSHTDVKVCCGDELAKVLRTPFGRMVLPLGLAYSPFAVLAVQKVDRVNMDDINDLCLSIRDLKR